MMIPRYVIIMRFPVISQTDRFPEANVVTMTTVYRWSHRAPGLYV